MKIQQTIRRKIEEAGAKNVVQVLSGVFIIVLTFILNGFLSFITVGFDWSKVLTSAYWANFGITTASEILVMYGMYIIQKTKDAKNIKITDLQVEIDNKRNVVYTLDKVTPAEDWLREIYNYRERLLIYERRVKRVYDRIVVVEPSEDEKHYKRKREKFNRQIAKKELLQAQMEYIKLDKKRLKLMADEAPEEQIRELEKAIDTDEYLFKTAKIRHREVYWGNLLSDMDGQSGKDSTPFFSEKTEISKSFIRVIGVGCVVSAFISALVFPTVNQVGWSFWLKLIITSITLIFFLVRGILLSKSIILGKYYRSLEKRKSIYVAMLKDLKISKIRIVEKGSEEFGENKEQ